MPGSLSYTTISNDRWDLISWKFYGDPSLYEVIIDANPAVPISPVLPQGVTLQIPIIVPPAPEVPANQLPPWGTL